jgi:hypothetical protein
MMVQLPCGTMNVRGLSRNIWWYGNREIIFPSSSGRLWNLPDASMMVRALQ